MAGEQEIVLGDLKIRLKLDDSGLDAQVKKSKQTADTMSANFEKAGKRIGLALVGATAAIATAVTLALKRADDLYKAAQKIGVGVDSLSRLEYAGRLADVSLDTLTQSIGKLNRNMSEVATGGGTAIKQAFDALDISIKNTDGSLRDTDDVFADVADRFSRMEDGARKTGLAMDLFGRSGAQLIPLLNEGKDGLKAAADEADRLGITLDSNSAAGAERFNDSLTRLFAGIQGIATRIAIALLPQLDKMSDFFESEDFQKAVQTFAQGAIQSIIMISQAIVGITNAAGDLFNFLAQKGNESGRRTGPATGLTTEELEKDIAEYRAMLSGGETLWDAEATTRRLHDLEQELEARRNLIQRFQPGMLGRGGAGREAPDESDNTEDDSFDLGGTPLGPTQEELDERLEMLRGALMSEMETEESIFKDRQAQLADFLEREMITKAEYDLLWEDMEKEHWERVKEIRKEAMTDLEKFNEMSWQDQAKTIFSELESITAGVKHENDVLFNINKAAAVANAVINTYEGISKSLSAYPMPLAAIMAGVHAAAGFAQVSSILSTTRNTTGGSAKGLSGAAGAADGANTSAGKGADQNVMYVKGLDASSLFTGGSIRQIAQGLLDFQRDGGQVVFEG